MKTLRITSATLAIIAAALLICGCSENKTDYDYDLIGGEVQNTDSNYDVDIHKDVESTPADNTTSKSEVDASAPAAFDTPKTSTGSKPATPIQPNNTSKPDTTSKEETGHTEVPKRKILRLKHLLWKAKTNRRLPLPSLSLHQRHQLPPKL